MLMSTFWMLLAIVAILLFRINRYYFSYWSVRGIPFKRPFFLLGEVCGLLMLKESFGEFFTNIYKKYKHERIVGIFLSFRPALVINDPELISEVMIKSFTSFHDRGLLADEKVDPLAGHLFLLSGQRWRDLRVKLSPVFTSGKLKGMFPTIRDCSKVLQEYTVRNVRNGDDVFDVRDLMARFTTNVISSVAFGIDNDCINEPDNIFRKMGLKIFEMSIKNALLGIVSLFVPKVFLMLKIKQVPKEIDDFFMSVTRDSVEFREKNKDYERKDFMQLMVQLKNQGYVSVDKEDEDEVEVEKGSSEIKKLTLEQIAAQSFVFFVAGFETSSSTMNFTLFELARNQEIQKKVHDEIDKVLKSRDISDITYETLNEMKYLECCIDEALRKYPIIPLLFRESTRNHTFAGTNYRIEKNTSIFIPVLGIQRNPDIYDSPMEFKPERFLNSSHGGGKAKGLFYMPFGDGPRNCIGARMGKLQSKIGLLTLLSKFKFEFADKSFMHKEVEFDQKQFILTPKESIMLKAVPR